MAFDFPANPTPGSTYSPAGGPTYVWDGSAWAISAISVMPPNDGGEYVMVNGAWRLSRQGFDLTGLATLDIPVPSWNPAQVRATLVAQNTSTANQIHYLRASADGTNFLSTSGNYTHGGFVHYNGTSQFQSVNNSGSTGIVMASGGTHGNLQQRSEVTLDLGIAGTAWPTYTVRGNSYETGPANLIQTLMIYGWITSGLVTDRIRALRWAASTAVPTGNLTVEWLP